MVASATISLSLTPGFSASVMSWYTPSTIAAAMLSSMSSSMFFTSRAASMHLLSVAHLDPELLQLEHHRRLDHVDPERHVADALGVEDRLDLARGVLKSS